MTIENKTIRLLFNQLQTKPKSLPLFLLQNGVLLVFSHNIFSFFSFQNIIAPPCLILKLLNFCIFKILHFKLAINCFGFFFQPSSSVLGRFSSKHVFSGEGNTPPVTLSFTSSFSLTRFTFCLTLHFLFGS